MRCIAANWALPPPPVPPCLRESLSALGGSHGDTKTQRGSQYASEPVSMNTS
jgi:hypothetical protein